MFLFKKEDVYIGYSFDDLSKVRGALDNEGIKHSYRVRSHSGQWSSRGTRRGMFGSFGMNMNYEKQYTVYVHRKDVERAKYLINRALHK
ncbi:MAG: hypothetical protein GX076_04695 [Clostridiales bacterium]|nr:hypothetical protein [Clostridiales bacterium]